MPKQKCTKCAGNVGWHSKIYCEYHAGYHAGHSKATMVHKREQNPDYCEHERLAVRDRMRKLRARPDYVRP